MTARSTSLLRALLLAAAVAWSAAPALAQHEHHATAGDAKTDPHAAHRAMMAAGAGTEAEAVSGLAIPDVPVLTQDGEERRFYSDLVAGKVVAMNFVFTTCTTICPPMGAIFGQLEKRLGDRLGRDVQLISVSVDPATDTPERLSAWAARFGRTPGWTLVTGDKPTVDALLKSLQVFTPDFEDHAPIVLLGNDARDEWTRAYGLAPPERLAEILDELTAGGTPPEVP